MTAQKYSLRKRLLQEEKQVYELAQASFWKAIAPLVDEADADYWQGFLAFRHSDGCSTEAYIAVNDEDWEDGNGGIWIDKIEVVKTDTRELHPQCFRKGYAKQMLEALTKAADVTGTRLSLIAASEPYYNRMYPGIELPDKDELADLYMGYGFVETSRNYAQVHMSRSPLNNRGHK